jgi:hypothetical protein
MGLKSPNISKWVANTSDSITPEHFGDFGYRGGTGFQSLLEYFLSIVQI